MNPIAIAVLAAGLGAAAPAPAATGTLQAEARLNRLVEAAAPAIAERQTRRALERGLTIGEPGLAAPAPAHPSRAEAAQAAFERLVAAHERQLRERALHAALAAGTERLRAAVANEIGQAQPAALVAADADGLATPSIR